MPIVSRKDAKARRQSTQLLCAFESLRENSSVFDFRKTIAWPSVTSLSDGPVSTFTSDLDHKALQQLALLVTPRPVRFSA